MEQKIKYSHNNPLQSHWNLVNEPKDYFWSSASFYETGKDDFGFLTHYNNLYKENMFKM
jgi:putative transposase